MDITVKGKHLDVGDALRTHVGDSLEAVISKYFPNALSAIVTVGRDAHLYRADIGVHVYRSLQMSAGAEADTPYGAVDRAVEKIAKRLRRYKHRLSDHHRVAAGETVLTASSYVLQGEPEDVGDDHEEPEQPIIVAEMTAPIESLTVSHAVMRMDLADLPALMFRNQAHGRLNMVYRRADGNIGWVDPQSSETAEQ